MKREGLSPRAKAVASAPAENGFDASLEPCRQKLRELVADLEAAGVVDRGGKGSHRNFMHPNVSKPITISGKLGDDAKAYQIRAVRRAIEDAAE